MKLAAIIVLAFILLTVLIFFIAALALTATRRARARDERASKEITEAEAALLARGAMEGRQTATEEAEEE